MSLVSIGTKLLGYGKRVAKVYPELVFGKGTDVIANAMKTTKGSVFTKAGAGWKALETTAKANQVGFFKGLWNSAKNLFPSIGQAAKAGAKAGGFMGGVKGFFKGIGKNMPFIGSVLLVAFEIPNIITAIKEKGIIQGLKETAKSAARLGGAAAGAAIGQALIPIPGVGALVGWIAGDWLTSKIVGKSYTEQKEEAAEAQAEAASQQNSGFDPNAINPGYNPYNPYFQGSSSNPFMNPSGNSYENDIMYQKYRMNAAA